MWITSRGRALPKGSRQRGRQEVVYPPVYGIDLAALCI
jgi:hypothetical protein